MQGSQICCSGLHVLHVILLCPAHAVALLPQLIPGSFTLSPLHV